MPLELGDIAKDTITGFKGVVVAVTKWIHGCRQITIQPETLKDGKPSERATFDEPQVKLVKQSVHATTSRTGGPTTNPTPRAMPSRAR